MAGRKEASGPGDGSGGVDEDEAVFSFEKPGDLAKLKEVKLQLPVSMHLKLHSLKITTGVTISGVVAEALEEYFERMAHSG